MKKILRLLGLLTLLGIVIGGSIGIYLYNKPHADLAVVEADYVLTAEALLAAFETNESEAYEKYLDKVLRVEGPLQEKQAVGDGGIVIFLRQADALSGVSCAFQPEAAAMVADLPIGKEIVVKGRCAGMLTDVNLTRCALANE